MSKRETREFNVNDRITPLRMLYRDSELVAVDISAFTVTFTMYDATTGVAKVTDGACTLTNGGTDGKAHYPWAVGDLDTAGRYYGYFKLALGGLSAQYPQTGNELVIVIHTVP